MTVRNLGNIITNLKKRKNSANKYDHNKSFGAKVLKLYFKEMKDLVFKGYEFKFPLNFGTAYIRRQERKTTLLKASKNTKTPLKDYNIKRFGQAYTLVIEGGAMKKLGYKIKLTQDDRKLLTRVLCNTNIEYRTAPAIQ